MPNRDETWTPVWAAVRARHEELGWTNVLLYEKTGISEPTFTKRLADNLPLKRRDKIAGLEDGLGWRRGSVAAILAGGEPTVVADPSAGGDFSSLDVAELRREVSRLHDEVEAVKRTMKDVQRQWKLELAKQVVEAMNEEREARP